MSSYKHFSACYNCKPPKRHPGCHATCPEYAEDRKNYDAMKETHEIERKTNIIIGIPGFYRAFKKNRRKK